MIRKFITAAAFALVAWFASIGPALAVDVNTASETELQTVKGIGPAISARIVAERKKGNFKDWADFQSRVNGVGDKTSVTMSQNGLTVDGASKANAPAIAAPSKPAAPAAAPMTARTPAPAPAPLAAPSATSTTPAPSTMSKPTPPAPTSPAATMAKPATTPIAPAATMAKPAMAPVTPAPAAAMTKPAAATPPVPSAPATKAAAQAETKDAKPAKAEAKVTGKVDPLSTSAVDQKPGKKKTEFATDPKKAPDDEKKPTKRTNDATSSK